METKTTTKKKCWAILTADHTFPHYTGEATMRAGTRFDLSLTGGLRLTKDGISLLNYHGIGGNELVPRNLLRFEEETITTVTTKTSTFKSVEL